MLSEGWHSGRQLILKESTLYRRAADLKPGQKPYELGWIVEKGSQSDLQIVGHSDDVHNYRSLIRFLSEKNSGVIILTKYCSCK